MWKVGRISDVVTKLQIPFKRSGDWAFRILVTADRHIDSAYSNLPLQTKHLKEAKKHNWPIIDIGDVMDAMQGTKDPRGCRSALIPYLVDKDEYFDAVVDFAHDFLSPYAKQFALMAYGNHETSVIKHNNTNLTRRLVNKLSENGSNVVIGGYAGWIKLMLTSGRTRQSLNVKYTHGAGGSSPVTKGVIKTNRRAVVWPDAHIVLSGHTHEGYCVPIARERISAGDKIYADDQLHVQVMSYKDATTNKGLGWEIEKEFAPKPVGAYWLELWYDNTMDRIRYDARRAL